MEKYTIKKNKNLGFGIFNGEFNSINYVLYLAFLFLIKSFAAIYFFGVWGFKLYEPLGLWHAVYTFLVVDYSYDGLLLFFSIQILALLPIVYRILNGNGHRNFFIFLALNLVLNLLVSLISNVYWSFEWNKAFLLSLSLLPLFISFNPKEISNIDIKISSKTKLSGNLYDDLD
tara:strand:- start:222 stop:740 length:519 start_codon:yes stop_codon:yes gene_type:complete